MGKSSIETRLYSYAGPRLSGVAWAAIKKAEPEKKPVIANVEPQRFNGRTREDIQGLYARYRGGEIPTKAALEQKSGLPFKQVKRLSRFIERR